MSQHAALPQGSTITGTTSPLPICRNREPVPSRAAVVTIRRDTASFRRVAPHASSAKGTEPRGNDWSSVTCDADAVRADAAPAYTAEAPAHETTAWTISKHMHTHSPTARATIQQSPPIADTRERSTATSRRRSLCTPAPSHIMGIQPMCSVCPQGVQHRSSGSQAWHVSICTASPPAPTALYFVDAGAHAHACPGTCAIRRLWQVNPDHGRIRVCLCRVLQRTHSQYP